MRARLGLDADVRVATHPSDWRDTRLKFTVNGAVGGHWGAEPLGGDTDTVCLRVVDFDFERGGLKRHEFTLRSLAATEQNSRELREGDLLLEKSGGGDRQPVGRVVRVDQVFDRPAVSSNFIARLRPQPGFDPRYLCYLHRALYTRGVTRVAIKQTTGIQNLDVDYYLGTWIPIPPGDDQSRIADFLDAETDRIGKVVRAKQQLLALLTEKRRALYAAAAAGQRSTGTSRGARANLPWLPSIPDHWRVAKLTLVARLGTGHTPSRSTSAYWETDRDIPWVTTSDIEQFRDDRVDVLADTKERISRIGLENSAAVLHPQGTVALSRTASVGFPVVMGADMATSQDFVTWTCSSLLEPRFLLICLRAMRRDLVGRLAMGSTHKTIYMPDIESLRIPLPSTAEQQQITHRVEREASQLDEMAERVNRQLPLFAERRDALITAAVTGQLDPSSYRESAVAA